MTAVSYATGTIDAWFFRQRAQLPRSRHLFTFSHMWQWLVVAGIALVVWRLARPAGDCVIRVRRGQVAVRGKLAAGRRAEIERFLAEQFPDVRRLRIDVHFPRAAQPLRVRIRGSVTRGEQQLIRNFLSTLL